MSHPFFKQHEMNINNNFKNKRLDKGIRELIYEKDLLKYIGKERAIKLGYERQLDFERTQSLVLQNHAVENHATAELRKDRPIIYNSRTVLLANFSFLLRVVGYHLVIVGLPNNPWV